jgi:AraC-like DNA-binding protein
VTELAFALVAQGGLLALILAVMESRYPLANRFLAGLLVALSVSLLARGLTTRLDHGHHWIGILYNFTFLIGPCFHFYTLALTNRRFSLSSRDLVHAGPALAAACFALVTDLDRALMAPGQVGLIAAIGLLNAISLGAYAIAALRQLARYRRALLDQYSAIERISLDWLKMLAVIVLAFGIAIAVMNGIRFIWGLPPAATAIIVVPFSLVIFYTVAILGFRQSSVLLIGTPTDVLTTSSVDADEERSTPSAKYERSGLDDNRAQRIWSRLEALMAAEAPYLDPELELPALAARLNVSPQTLSEVLGRIAGSRFYDYINKLRVERAKNLLRDPACAGTSVLDVAMAAGFKSKSTFNKYFREAVGQTPTDYRHASPESEFP